MAKRYSLLIVDDEPEVVQSLQDLLRFDYRVLGTNRALDAIKILESEQVQIVLSDQRMPEMNGVELFQRLRETHPEIIRLLCTGYADIRAVIDAINEGHVFRYITKPWDTDELLTVLRQAGELYDLLQERKDLLAELQQKNRQLEGMNAELLQANNLKDAFIKVASHELRTPLTIILGLAELARQANSVEAPLGQWLNQIHAGSQRLHRLIDQMTQYLAAGNFERSLARQEVALADLMQAAVNDMAPFVTQRRQTLELNAPSDLGTLFVEPDKIRDSVAHLLLNAIKFTPDGGAIHLSARRLADGSAEIQVRDSGIGIDPVSLNQLFEPFFTGFDVSRHRSGVFEFDRRGLGLGLSLVKAFVEMHGGKIRATSELGKGSTFMIQLPPASPKTGGA